MFLALTTLSTALWALTHIARMVLFTNLTASGSTGSTGVSDGALYARAAGAAWLAGGAALSCVTVIACEVAMDMVRELWSKVRLCITPTHWVSRALHRTWLLTTLSVTANARLLRLLCCGPCLHRSVDPDTHVTAGCCGLLRVPTPPLLSKPCISAAMHFAACVRTCMWAPQRACLNECISYLHVPSFNRSFSLYDPCVSLLRDAV